MVKKTVNVYVLKKKHTTTGNPSYTLFIPELTGQVKGLRKLKRPHMYSVVTYNLNQHLKDYSLKGYNVKIER